MIEETSNKYEKVWISSKNIEKDWKTLTSVKSLINLDNVWKRLKNIEIVWKWMKKLKKVEKVWKS